MEFLFIIIFIIDFIYCIWPNKSTLSYKCLLGTVCVAYTNFQTTSCDAQSVTCLTADKSLAVDPGVASLIPAPSFTFMEIDHEIISKAIHIPSPDSRRVVVSYKRKYVYEVLVNS